MAVRSLVGGCATQTRVIAVGVESGDEWKMLRHLRGARGAGPWFAEPEPFTMPPDGWRRRDDEAPLGATGRGGRSPKGDGPAPASPPAPACRRCG